MVPVRRDQGKLLLAKVLACDRGWFCHRVRQFVQRMGVGGGRMLEVSQEFTTAFDRRLEKAAVPAEERPDYMKWALYYLDFCQKYGHPLRASSSLGPFLTKLQAKRQSA